MSTTTTDRISALTDAEQAYIARWVAVTHPEVARGGLEALAEYRRDHPDKAALLLGAGTNGGK